MGLSVHHKSFLGSSVLEAEAFPLPASLGVCSFLEWETSVRLANTRSMTSVLWSEPFRQTGPLIIGGKATTTPWWIETSMQPADAVDMGGWTASAFSPDQQRIAGVDASGNIIDAATHEAFLHPLRREELLPTTFAQTETKLPQPPNFRIKLNLKF